jgi:formylglycine-generating enzyme required for sulfatase activity
MVESRVVQIAGIDTEFVKCPSGSFRMGSVHGLPLEQPIRDVTIEDPFWISTMLVTQRVWASVMPENPSLFRDSINLPVDGITHEDAIAFCISATKLSGHHLSLPTEAQWEYACRAGTTTEYFWGSSHAEATNFGWFDLNSRERTHEVGELEANPWGLHDIVGNLWEWCLDVWHSDYIDAPQKNEPWYANNEHQPRRCLRGGAWDMDVFRLRSAYRSFDHRDLGTSRFGMRVVIGS